MMLNLKESMMQTKRKPGRPVEPNPLLLRTSIRLSSTHWAKFKALGGVRWLRSLLDAE